MSRRLRVSVCAFNQCVPESERRPGDTSLVERALDMAQTAQCQGAQLAVFPEVFAVLGWPNFIVAAEPLDGPTFSVVAATARRMEMFIAVNHPTLIDGKKRNTTVLFDRAGAVAGLYHKTYPTIGEMEDGCAPGDGPVVLDTELGRIGFAICYDLNFPELRLAYQELAPDVILFCSMFRGGLQTRWWAYETRAHFVSSVFDPSSRIINPVGRILREITGFTRQMTATLELDCGVFHLDGNGAKLEQLRRKWGRQLEIDFVEAEGLMLLSAIGQTPLATIVADLELEPLADYFARALKCKDRMHAGAEADRQGTGGGS